MMKLSKPILKILNEAKCRGMIEGYENLSGGLVLKYKEYSEIVRSKDELVTTLIQINKEEE